MDVRRDGQTLFYRTLPAETAGPTMLKYANFTIFVKLFTISNLSPYFEKVK